MTKQDDAPKPAGGTPVDCYVGRLAPERAGQPRMMIIIDGAQEDETGHWYSPAAVREMLAAERDRCATRAWVHYMDVCKVHRCPEPRTVDCCGVVDEHDIVECHRCGKQWTVPCNFDEDYS